MQEVQNGKKFYVGDLNSTNYLYVAKLKGTHYEMGKAFGQLFKEELKEQLPTFFKYIEEEVNTF